MSTYQLHIIRNGEKEIVLLTEGETLRIPAEEDTQYQFVNEQGEALSGITTERVGQDLNIYLTATDTPEVLIYDYGIYAPSEAVFNSKILASEVITVAKSGISSVWPFAVGGVALFGGALAIAGNSSKSKGTSQEKPISPSLPEKNVEPTIPTEETKPTEPTKPIKPSTPIEPPQPEKEPAKQINGEIILNDVNAKNLLNTDHLSETFILSGRITADQPLQNVTV